MPLEGPDFLGVGEVPEAQRAIRAARERELAIRRKRRAAHRALMPAQAAQLLAQLQVPEPDRAIAAGGEGTLAVG